MTTIEKLGNRCTTTICHKTCPVYYFKNEGAGKGTGNNCIEAMRFPNVAQAVKLWINGKPWSKETLHDFGGYDT